MPMLAKWPKLDLKNLFKTSLIDEKHGWPESMAGLLFKMLKMTITGFVNFNG
jgi:hypothetical protein